MPQQAAGMRIEPPPSVPSAAGAMAVATAAAEPPDEPPEVRSRSQGFGVAPKTRFLVNPECPNSGVWVLPITIPPACFERSTITASESGTFPLKTQEPRVVSTPFVGVRSLIAIGT